jgi:hypothetical protein
MQAKPKSDRGYFNIHAINTQRDPDTNTLIRTGFAYPINLEQKNPASLFLTPKQLAEYFIKSDSHENMYVPNYTVSVSLSHINDSKGNNPVYYVERPFTKHLAIMTKKIFDRLYAVTDTQDTHD